MIVITCPGQGSQKPGFLSPWAEVPEYRARLAEMSAAIGVDLLRHGTESDAETIKDTAVAQPLIVASGILAIDALRSNLTAAGAAEVVADLQFAGHSVGEITAAYGAGIFDAATAMRFVAARSRAMQECAQTHDTSMAAVLGGELAEIEPQLSDLGLTPANYNGGGQIVVGGSSAAVAELVANPPARTRVIQLQVAGAFHTAAMAAAQQQLQAIHSEFTVKDPAHKIYTNADGSTVSSGAEYLDLLVRQVASPVRWDLCMEAFAAGHVTALVEVTPSGALAGLARRGLKGVPCHKIDTPADAAAAAAALIA